MKFYLQLGLILLAFCVVATALLAYVNSITKPMIETLKIKEAEEARNALIPNAEFEEVHGALDYYIARDKETKALKGYTFTAEKAGYNGPVKTMAAVDNTFKIIKVQVISQTETPGLGSNSTKPEFAAQFSGKVPEQLLVDKDGGAIKSLTGATITSRAVTNSLKEQVELLKKELTGKGEVK